MTPPRPTLPLAAWVPPASRVRHPVARRPLLGVEPLRAALVLLMVVTISRVHLHIAAIGQLRPALVLSAFAVLWAILDPRALDLRGLFRYRPAQLILGLAIMASLSAVFGIAPGRSVRYLFDEYATVLFFAFFLIAVIRSGRDLRLFVWAYVASAAILVWMSLWVFNLREVRSSGVERLASLYTYDANDLGCVLMIGLVLALLTFQSSGRWGKLFSAAVLVGSGAAIARTGSRGAFLGLIAVGLALLLALTHVSFAKRLGFVAIVVVAVVVAAPPGYWNQIETLRNPGEDYNWRAQEGRKQVWQRGMGYMLRYPFFGVGINNFPRAEGTISGKEWTQRRSQSVRWTAAHNSFVQVGAELGVPGLLLWSGLVIGGIVGPLRLRRRLPPGWARGDPDEAFLYQATLYLPIAVVGFAATAFFLSFAYMDPLYVLAALGTGLYAAIDRRLRGAGAG